MLTKKEFEQIKAALGGMLKYGTMSHPADQIEQGCYYLHPDSVILLLSAYTEEEEEK